MVVPTLWRRECPVGVPLQHMSAPDGVVLLGAGRADEGAVVTDSAIADTARAKLNRARDLGQTCSASRHVHTLLDDLLAGRVPQQLIDEPQHCGESIAAVLAELWHRRKAMGYSDRYRR